MFPSSSIDYPHASPASPASPTSHIHNLRPETPIAIDGISPTNEDERENAQWSEPTNEDDEKRAVEASRQGDAQDRFGEQGSERISCGRTIIRPGA